MNRVLYLLGGLLICAGLVLSGVPTGAFSQVSADRGVSVDVASQSDAYLSATDIYDGSTVRNFFCVVFFGCFQSEQPQAAIDLENRFVQDFTTVEAQVVEVQNARNDALEVQNVPGQLNQDQGEPAELDLACSGERRADNTGDVTIEVSVSGDSVRTTAEVVVQDIDYNCAQIN
jgi:hypothetical protein